METVTVIRLEHTGRGVYHSDRASLAYHIEHLADMADADDTRPAPFDDGMGGDPWEGPWMGCWFAFADLRAALAWFPYDVLTGLRRAGVRIVEYKVRTEGCIWGRRQMAFSPSAIVRRRILY